MSKDDFRFKKRTKVTKHQKKIKTNKKGLVNVDEIQAHKVAYEKPLNVKDYSFYIGTPAVILGGFTFILLYYWWFSLIMAVVGGIYGAVLFLPKAVTKNYEMHSFRERNKFINNMTQILTDDSKTVPRSLMTAAARSEGEFKEDLLVLQARLMGADNQTIQDAFRDVEDKYEGDVVFVQYVEQLETTMLEGRTNIDTLQDIKTYHNDIKVKQDEYQKEKNGYLKDMRMLLGVMVVFILAISFSFGFELYKEAFAHNFVGWVTIGIYLLLMGNYFRTFSKYLFDDSIMEVQK